MPDIQDLERRIAELEAEVKSLKALAVEADGFIAMMLGAVAQQGGVTLNIDGAAEDLPEPHREWLRRISEQIEEGGRL